MAVWHPRAEDFAEFVARSAGRLVALAAAHGGQRRSMGWLRDEFFLGMAEELQHQGISRKVAADMLGMSRRTLLRQLEAADQASDQRRRSVWLRVYRRALAEPVTRQDLDAAFRTVEPRTLASVVRDMVDNGWLEERSDGRLRAIT